MDIKRVFGRTPEADLVTKFSGWFAENMEQMDILEDEEAIQGTMTIDFQHPTSSFVIEVQTYSGKFADSVVSHMKELGFENASIVNKEGEIS